MIPRWLLGAHFACLRLVVASDASRFVIITSPTESKVFWQALETDLGTLIKQQIANEPLGAQVLIDGVASKCVASSEDVTKGILARTCAGDADQGLQTPTGIAIFSTQSAEYGKGEVHTLYVSDAHNSKIFAYPLNLDRYNDKILVGSQREIIQVAQHGAKWLASDSFGDLYYAAPNGGDSGGAKIFMLKRAALDKAPGTVPKAHELYSTAKSDPITNKPGGIAVDNFFVYWANEDSGSLKGSVVKAPDIPKPGKVADGPFPKALAKNSDYTYGVCIARDSVFYTAKEKTLYGVKKLGGMIAEISSAFETPRGCAFDGDATLLVADETLGYVYALPSNMPKLRAVKKLQKVVKVKRPSGIAILVSGTPRWSLAALATGLTVVTLCEVLGW